MAKIIVIGAGHNGLVTSCYLAKAGHEVLVFEKRNVVGGCSVTDEETFPGFKISSAAYVNSLFLPQIVEDLNLEKYGYEILLRDPTSFTPLPDGRYLMLSGNQSFSINEIAKFSKKDAEVYSKYEQALDRIAKFVNETLTMIPPTSLFDFRKIYRITKSYLRLGPVSGLLFLQMFIRNANSFLNSWFESDALKATLLTDSMIGAVDFNSYVLLHHVMGEGGGVRGVWGYQRGGMGGLSNALLKAAEDLGVRVYTNWPIKKIITPYGKAIGVMLSNGTLMRADLVVSNVDPKLTFTRLISDKTGLNRFSDRIRKLDFRSASMKINLTLSGLPNFKCLPGTDIGPQHKGTIHFAPSIEYILKAADEGNQGIPSTRPILEVTIPSTIDDTLAPPGNHVMNIFLQYAPYHLSEGSWDDIKEEYFNENVMNVLREYIDNIDDIITGVQILSPLDLEREFSLTEGNLFHGAMTLSQLFSFRPLWGYADYTTPIEGLYLCGAGTHPGGGVLGANGLNAANKIISDINP